MRAAKTVPASNPSQLTPHSALEHALVPHSPLSSSSPAPLFFLCVCAWCSMRSDTQATQRTEVPFTAIPTVQGLFALKRLQPPGRVTCVLSSVTFARLCWASFAIRFDRNRPTHTAQSYFCFLSLPPPLLACWSALSLRQSGVSIHLPQRCCLDVQWRSACVTESLAAR